MDSIIYTRIKELCTEQGISIGKLEANVGMSSTSISKWKQGSAPTIDKISKVANYFNVSIDYLVGASNIRCTADALAGDPDYICLQRARERMTEKDRRNMIKMLQIGFEYAFTDSTEGDGDDQN